MDRCRVLSIASVVIMFLHFHPCIICPLKDHFAGRKFTNYDNLKSDIAEFLESQPPEFWAKGIGDLPNRWATVVDNCGDHIVD
ncbi:unnamed protein product [Heligmosomoides polygyrus]|uniref:Secreted protein n=1 Tax=Heligmosomoides polygyrus TaxID=6339 RepID=A0A183G299_HELPZ|nr:unnamed protein product [Heligmosomoides polygyrus]